MLEQLQNQMGPNNRGCRIHVGGTTKINVFAFTFEELTHEHTKKSYIQQELRSWSEANARFPSTFLKSEPEI